MSSASAPISKARTASAINSPALGADHAGAQDTLGFLVADHLGEAFAAADTDGTAAGGPGENGLFDGDALGLGLGFGESHPGDFRVRIGDRGDGQGLKSGMMPGDDFSRHLAFVGRLVRQHGIADDVADGVDVRDVGALPVVHRDEAGFGDRRLPPLPRR